jgi:nucleotide-binding universal stress UspA family protein
MFPLKKILLPIDFSERCLGGARYAIPLVEHFHSELTLLHVISPMDYLSPEVQTFNEDRRKKASKELDEVVIYLTQVDTTCSMAGYGGIPAEPERV